jgi:hypothetical protein
VVSSHSSGDSDIDIDIDIPQAWSRRADLEEEYPQDMVPMLVQNHSSISLLPQLAPLDFCPMESVTVLSSRTYPFELGFCCRNQMWKLLVHHVTLCKCHSCYIRLFCLVFWMGYYYGHILFSADSLYVWGNGWLGWGKQLGDVCRYFLYPRCATDFLILFVQ